MSPTASDQPETHLTGRPLFLARGAWIAVVGLSVGLYLFNIPLQFAYFQIVCSRAVCPVDQLSPAGLEQLRQAGLSLGFFAGYFTALNVIVKLVFCIIAAVIFWRKSDDGMGIFASLVLVLFGITLSGSPITPVGQQYPALLLPSLFLTFLGGACFTLFFYLFPDGRFVPRWIVWLVPFVVVHNALAAFRPDLFPFPYDWFLPVEVASILFAQIYR
jgi:hypothetical protein